MNLIRVMLTVCPRILVQSRTILIIRKRARLLGLTVPLMRVIRERTIAGVRSRICAGVVGSRNVPIRPLTYVYLMKYDSKVIRKFF